MIQLPDMNDKRSGWVAISVGNTVCIVGEKKCSNSSCEVFDTSTNTWLSPIPNMNKRRCSCQAVTIGPNIYIIGGLNDSTTLSSVEMF